MIYKKRRERQENILKWHFQGSRIGVCAHLLHPLMVLHHCRFSLILLCFYFLMKYLLFCCDLFLFCKVNILNNYCQNSTLSLEIIGCQFQTELEALIFLSVYTLRLADALVLRLTGLCLTVKAGYYLMQRNITFWLPEMWKKWHNITLDLFTSRKWM